MVSRHQAADLCGTISGTCCDAGSRALVNVLWESRNTYALWRAAEHHKSLLRNSRIDTAQLTFPVGTMGQALRTAMSQTPANTKDHASNKGPKDNCAALIGTCPRDSMAIFSGPSFFFCTTAASHDVTCLWRLLHKNGAVVWIEGIKSALNLTLEPRWP